MGGPRWGGRRRARRGPGVILYGRNAVREALRAGRRPVHEVWATKRVAGEDWLKGVKVHMADGGQIEQRAEASDHQGVAARVGPYPYADPNELLRKENAFLVALDELQDVQNLGAIARTAETAGADGVVICERRAAEVTPAVCKASAGAVEHLPVARVGNLADFLVKAKERNVWCYGAAGEARTSYLDVDWRGSVCIVLGAEGKGLRRRVADTCDDLVSLPMQGRIESLNVSATGAILLYTALQARLRP
ncbi:MAG: 23S rRNA (guanosine(2251)-2'-O)-methyltransferase RlmB [Solirubrobacteraceae bacterium]|nr:23S rRNA (guanosine(2251)-2'-O)-methyltransferase RlmB [Solirubrobacteraceae bacterium]